MSNPRSAIAPVVLFATLLCIASVLAWVATGREGYTRWPDERLARSDAPPAAVEAELLAEAGLSDEATPSAPEIRSRFALGLVPGGFDPAHLLSVAGVVAVSFMLVAGTLTVHLFQCRRRGAASSSPRLDVSMEVPQCDRS